ncbi:MAG: RNA-guided endonuclease TnpB family protein [Sarcina sp.]
MAKTKTPSYVLTLGLNIEKYQEDVLNKRFEKCRKIYNACLSEGLRRYRHMTESKAYRKNCKSKDKDRNKKFNELNKKYGLTKYSLQNFVTPMYNHFGLDSKTAQNQSNRAFDTLQKLIFHTANRVKFIKYNELYSVECGDNRQGITYRDGIIKWKGLSIPVIIKKNDSYTQKAIQDRVKYCRIVRKEIKGKFRYYVQLVMEGIPPMKVKSTGEVNSAGVGNVGIDIGTRTIAISSKYDVKLMELAPNVDKIDKQLKLIERKMDRSKRATNPNKFNDDGTINRSNRDKWNFSNKYLKLKAIRKEMFRKQTIYRKQDHEKMANYIISLGDNINVETMNFKGLQSKAKNTTVNEKTGKFNKKKRFGKSLANKAPAMLIEIINRKLKYENLEINKVNTYKVKASQYNHFTGECNKKELKDRWNKDIEIQRDLYSAFLLMNANKDLESINRELCIETYDNFKELHDKEIVRLRELKLNGSILISSMGI